MLNDSKALVWTLQNLKPVYEEVRITKLCVAVSHISAVAPILKERASRPVLYVKAYHILTLKKYILQCVVATLMRCRPEQAFAQKYGVHRSRPSSFFQDNKEEPEDYRRRLKLTL